MQETIKRKNRELELVILPPKEFREVSQEEIVQTLAQLVYYLLEDSKI